MTTNVSLSFYLVNTYTDPDPFFVDPTATAHRSSVQRDNDWGETRETRKTGGDGNERRREKEKIKKKKKEIDRCRRRRLRRTLFTGTKLDTSRGIHREARGKSEKEAEEEAAWNGKGHTVREV